MDAARALRSVHNRIGNCTYIHGFASPNDPAKRTQTPHFIRNLQNVPKTLVFWYGFSKKAQICCLSGCHIQFRYKIVRPVVYAICGSKSGFESPKLEIKKKIIDMYHRFPQFDCKLFWEVFAYEMEQITNKGITSFSCVLYFVYHRKHWQPVVKDGGAQVATWICDSRKQWYTLGALMTNL